MRQDATDDEVAAGVGKVDDLDAVGRGEAWIETSVEPISGLVDQTRHRRRRRIEGWQDVDLFDPVVVDHHEMKARDDDVHGSAGLDVHFVGLYYMNVRGRRCRDLEPIERRVALPR